MQWGHLLAIQTSNSTIANKKKSQFHNHALFVPRIRRRRSSTTLPNEVSTTLDDCSTDCKNLKTRFQFPLHRLKTPFRAFGLIGAYIGWDPHNWNAAKSTKDRKLGGNNPWWLPLNARETSSRHTRSTTLSFPQLSISTIKWEGKSSIEGGLKILSAICDKYQ